MGQSIMDAATPAMPPEITDPSFNVVKSVEMKLIVKLLRTDRLGQ